MRANFFPLLVVLALVSISTSAFAADKPGAKDKPKQTNEVTEVNPISITVYRSYKEYKYTVTKDTKVVVDYKPAKIDDVKVGMTATVSHKTDSPEATSINARSSPKSKGK